MNLEDIHILVVGDMMLDKYILGTVERISPEAPVPIVKVVDEYSTLGGCGNVVRNLKELGVKVSCLSSVGNDSYGKFIHNELKRIGVQNMCITSLEKTTVKERIIADQRMVQMIRIDREDPKEIPAKEFIDVLDTWPFYSNEYDIIIVSDYAKGVITKELMDFLKTKDTKIIVDPKPENSNLYGRVYMITPNEKEWDKMHKQNPHILESISYLLETRGKEGMTLMDGHKTWNIEADPVDVYNVSGCGDVAVAVVSVCISMNIPPVTSAQIANRCAGYTATLPGTSVIPKEKFEKYMTDFIKDD